MLKIVQKGFNYFQDGPGNRLVYHLQGCNMRCPWCANPEGLSVQGILIHVKDANSGRVKEQDIHIAMENNGTCPRLQELLPYIDYLIMDFKHPNAEVHKQVTLVSNENTKKNLIQIFGKSFPAGFCHTVHSFIIWILDRSYTGWKKIQRYAELWRGSAVRRSRTSSNAWI